MSENYKKKKHTKEIETRNMSNLFNWEYRPNYNVPTSLMAKVLNISNIYENTSVISP